MIRFECKKCGSLVVTEKESKTATCTICGKTQRIPAVFIEDRDPITRNDYDPQWNHYAKLVYKARTYRDIKVLRETADEFYRLGTYKDSLQMAEFCEKRIAEEQDKRNIEDKKRDIQEKRTNKGRKGYHIKMAFLNAGVVAFVIGVTILSNMFIKQPKYDNALALMNEGQYREAIHAFRKLGSYKDSKELMAQCDESILDERYNNAIAYMEAGNYPYAQVEFTELNGFKDSDTMILEGKYRQAQKHMDDGNYNLAWQIFTAIGDYKDAAELANVAKANLSNP